MTQRKLAKNIGIMSIAVFLSRILGLVRDQIMAYFFGTTYINDAFNVAYNIPNLLRRLFGEGALSAAFVPMYNEIGLNKGKQEQMLFAINVISILTLFLSILTFIGIAFAPLIVRSIYPGLPPESVVLAIKLSRIMFPYLFFIGLSSTCIAILNSHDYFFMTGLSSALLNIGMVSTVLVPHYLWGLTSEKLVIWAGWGVFLGGVLQTLVNYPYLKKIGYSFKFVLSFTGKSISDLWKRFIPAMIGIGIREINLIADALMASFLPIGSITSLGIGNRLMQMPLGIFGISTGSAVLPSYSKNITEKNWSELSRSLKFATISLALIMFPITAMIAVLGSDFVRILFQRGVFDSSASKMTEQALFYYSLGLIFYSLNQTITPLFYANKDTKTPVKIAAYMVLLNIILNFILMQFIQHRGLALSTSITAMINYYALLYLIKKSIPQIKFSGILMPVIKILAINIVLVVILQIVHTRLMLHDFKLLILKDIVCCLLYFTFFIAIATALKVPYLDDMKTKLWSRLVKR